MIATSFIDTALKPFINAVAWLLSAAYGVTHSYAVSIGIVTLMMMVLLLPLTLKSTKSMLEMQKVQPLVKQIQADFKNDMQGRNEAMMALYKEHKINPAGGCLPMLLQMPFFMTMWRVLFGLTRVCKDGVNGLEKCETGTFIPKYLDQKSELYNSLLGKKQMLSVGLDLSEAAYKVIQANIVRGLPYLALVIVVGLLSYYQQRQMTARQTGAAVNPQQQMIMNLMPIFFGFISLTFASGLIIYFLVQNIFRIAQNAYITRKFYGEESDDGGIQDALPKPKKPTPNGGGDVQDAPETKLRPRPSGNHIVSEKASTPPKGKPTAAAAKAKPTAAAAKAKPTPSAPPGRPKPPSKGAPSRPARPVPKKK